MADLAELGIVVKFQDPQNSTKKLRDLEKQASRTHKATSKLKSAGQSASQSFKQTSAASGRVAKSYSDLQSRISALSREFRKVRDTPKGLKDLSTRLNQVDRAARSSYESGKITLQSYKSLAKQSDRLSASIKTQSQTLQSNAAQYREAENASKQYIQRLRQQQAAQNNLARNKQYEQSRQRELQRLRNDIQLRSQVAQDYAAHDAAAQQYNKTLQKQSTATANVNENMQRMREAFDRVYRRVKQFASFLAAAALLMGLQQAVRATINTLKEFDQALYSLQAITGATAREAQVLGESIRDIARDTKFSAGEVAAGMEVLGKAGFNAAESIGMIGPVAQLATGALEDFETVGSLAATTMRAFQLETVEAGRVADTFANAVTNSKLTIDRLAIAFGYVGAAGKQAGLSLEEVTGTLMVLADNGIRASTSGTALRRTLLGLLRPSTELKADLMEAGLAMKDINPKMVGWQKTLENLTPLMWDFETNTVDMAKATDYFGLRAAQVAAILGRETAQGGALRRAEEQTKEIGAAARMAALQQEGLGIKFKNLVDRTKNVALALGDAGLTGVLENVIDALRSASKATESFIKAFPEVAQVAGWTTAIAGLVGVIYALRASMKYLIPMATGFWAALTGPIGMAVTAIATVAAAVVQLRGRMDNLSKAHEEQAIAIKKNVDALEGWQKALKSAAQQSQEQYRNTLRRFIEENEDLSKSVLKIIDNMDMFENETVDSIENVLVAAGSLKRANKIFQEALQIKQIREAKKEINKWGGSLEKQSLKVERLRDRMEDPAFGGLLGQMLKVEKEDVQKVVESNRVKDIIASLGNELALIAELQGEGVAEKLIKGLDITGEFKERLRKQFKDAYQVAEEGLQIEKPAKKLGRLPKYLREEIDKIKEQDPIKYSDLMGGIDEAAEKAIEKREEIKKRYSEEELKLFDIDPNKEAWKEYVSLVEDALKDLKEDEEKLFQDRINFYNRNAEELSALAEIEGDERKQALLKYQAKSLEIESNFLKKKRELIDDGREDEISKWRSLYDLKLQVAEKTYKEAADRLEDFKDVTLNFYSDLQKAAEGGKVGDVNELIPLARKELQVQLENTRDRIEDMRTAIRKTREEGGVVSDKDILRLIKLERSAEKTKEQLNELGEFRGLASLNDMSERFDQKLEAIYKRFGEGTPKAQREVNDLVEQFRAMALLLDVDKQKLQEFFNKIEEYEGPTGFDKVIQGLEDYEQKANDVWGNVSDAVTSSIKQMEDSLVDFVMTGKFEWRDLTNFMIKEIARVSIQEGITGPLAKGASDFDWGGFAAKVATWFHDGGIVGRGGTQGMASPALFSNAPRLHNGIQSDEYPAILQRGEGVFTQEQMKALGNNSPNVQVNVINKTGQQADVSQEQPKWDGERWVMNVVLNAANQNKNGFARGMNGALSKFR